MKISGNTYFLMIILALLLLMVILSVKMAAFSSKLMPLLIGGGVSVLAVIELVRELRRGKTPTEDKRSGISEEHRGYLIASLWIGGFFLAIYLLGFYLAIAIFVFAYMKTHGTKWLISIVFAVLITALVYGIFGAIMGVDLYKGLLLTYLDF